MASNGKRQLPPGLADPLPQTNSRNGPKCRKYRTRSAPLGNYSSLEGKGISNGTASAQQRPHSIMHLSFLKVAVVFLIVYLGLGILCFYLARHQLKGVKTNAVLDAVYFCVVTMTTLGYGDIVPNSTLAKLLACGFVFTGMALVGLILSKAADYLVERQEIILIKAMHMNDGPTEVLQKVKTAKSVRYKCVTVFILLLVLITTGTIFLARVEKMYLIDAFYCVCCTITTLGYGDKSFSTQGGRVFAVFWILASTTCLAQFFLYIAELNTQHRQKAFVKLVLNREMTKVDLEAADLDDDGAVGSAEFVIYKLQEMGKITQEDVRLVMKQFEALDVDQNGSLSITDVTLAQSAEA